MSAVYTAEFTSIKNVNYKIEINTEKGSGTHTLMLSGEPFSTKMDSEGKNIYSPLKTTSATVGIMTKSLESNIYSGKAKGTSIKFTNKIIYSTVRYGEGASKGLPDVTYACQASRTRFSPQAKPSLPLCPSSFSAKTVKKVFLSNTVTL